MTIDNGMRVNAAIKAVVGKKNNRSRQLDCGRDYAGMAMFGNNIVALYGGGYLPNAMNFRIEAL